MTKKVISKEENELLIKIAELTADLQRTRADFENYRKRVDEEKETMRKYGETTMAAKLLPIIDDIERAVAHLPVELTDNAWAKGVTTLAKNLDKTLEVLGITRIIAMQGTPFDPDLHHAVQFDKADGEHEVVAQELQPGYLLNGIVLRPAMVQVGRR
ncbi:nucleotide exchange factor GrpE [Candidatus Saccharibacteria bacterium]|nr:nucleotide exchange factor GrpE [Candidatus Saccharibacteria bacterium]